MTNKYFYSYAPITCVDSTALKSSWRADTPFHLLTCTVLANGEVIPTWNKDGTTGGFRMSSGSTSALINKSNSFQEITLSPFIGDGCLYLALDPGAYAQDNTGEKRAVVNLPHKQGDQS